MTLPHQVLARHDTAGLLAVHHFVIGIVGYYSVRRFHYPRSIFTVTGIIPLVPGIPAYEGLVELSKGELSTGLMSLVKATYIIAALAAGLTAARAFTWPERSAA